MSFFPSNGTRTYLQKPWVGNAQRHEPACKGFDDDARLRQRIYQHGRRGDKALVDFGSAGV
jgi:hypothetical protein